MEEILPVPTSDRSRCLTTRNRIAQETDLPPRTPNLNVVEMPRSELAKFIPFQRPPPKAHAPCPTLKLGARGGNARAAFVNAASDVYFARDGNTSGHAVAVVVYRPDFWTSPGEHCPSRVSCARGGDELLYKVVSSACVLTCVCQRLSRSLLCMITGLASGPRPGPSVQHARACVCVFSAESFCVAELRFLEVSCCLHVSMPNALACIGVGVCMPPSAATFGTVVPIRASTWFTCIRFL